MPAGTVGAAYAEQAHLDKTRKIYHEQVNSYELNEQTELLMSFSGLEMRVIGTIKCQTLMKQK